MEQLARQEESHARDSEHVVAEVHQEVMRLRADASKSEESTEAFRTTLSEVRARADAQKEQKLQIFQKQTFQMNNDRTEAVNGFRTEEASIDEQIQALSLEAKSWMPF